MTEISEIIAVSIVPPDFNVPKGDLHRLDLRECLWEVRNVLAQSGLITWGILGSDLSYNVLAQKHLSNRWQFQAYGAVETTNRRKLRDLVNAAYPATSSVPRPIRTKTYDGSARGASYVLKYQFVKRITYWAKVRGKRCWNTRKVRLSASEHIELMLALDKLGLKDRLGLIRMEPTLKEERVLLTRTPTK